MQVMTELDIAIANAGLAVIRLHPDIHDAAWSCIDGRFVIFVRWSDGVSYEAFSTTDLVEFMNAIDNLVWAVNEYMMALIDDLLDDDYVER